MDRYSSFRSDSCKYNYTPIFRSLDFGARGAVITIRCFPGREPLDVNSGRLALALLYPLYQANALAAVQLCQQLDRLIVAAIKGHLDCVQWVVDEHPVFIVI